MLFIISKKTRKSLVGSIFVCGVIFLGIGGGIIAVSIIRYFLNSFNTNKKKNV